MKTTFKFSLLAVIISLVQFSAIAQEQPTQIPEALTNVLRLEGYWEGSAILILEGRSHKFTYTIDFSKTADGNGLSMDEWFSDPELGTYKGANLIGYNANDEKIHWFNVDNFGTVHEHLGTWESADHFYMQANEMQQQKKFVEKINLVLKGNDTMELNMVATLDGEEIEKVDATFHRKIREASK